MSLKRQHRETKQIRIYLELHRELCHLSIETNVRLVDLTSKLIKSALSETSAKIYKLLRK
jgi:hypothetical protein